MSHRSEGRIEAEAARDLAERRLRAFQDGIPNLAWTARLDGSIDYCNQRWLEYTGRPTHQMLDWAWTDVLHQEDRERFFKRWEQAMEAGQAFEEELRLRRYDGTYRWHSLRDWPERDAQGTVTRWFGTATDVDDQRRMADELRGQQAHLQMVNRGLDQFAAEASHDLQAPLRQIITYIDLVELRQGSVLDESSRRYLEYARMGAERMREMITGLLDYARAGRVDPAAERPLAARQAAQEAMDNLATIIADTEAEVHIDELPTVYSERRSLVRVFQNLVENALRYRDQDRRPEVWIVNQGAEDDRCRICVRDNGRGIPLDMHERIFQVFDRGDIGDGEGTGIGLALVKRIIEERGGKISLESELGKGTSFYFTLPCARNERPGNEASGGSEAA